MEKLIVKTLKIFNNKIMLGLLLLGTIGLGVATILVQHKSVNTADLIDSFYNKNNLKCISSENIYILNNKVWDMTETSFINKFTNLKIGIKECKEIEEKRERKNQYKELLKKEKLKCTYNNEDFSPKEKVWDIYQSYIINKFTNKAIPLSKCE
jgi:hypothetical protein